MRVVFRKSFQSPSGKVEDDPAQILEYNDVGSVLDTAKENILLNAFLNERFGTGEYARLTLEELDSDSGVKICRVWEICAEVSK